MLGWQGLPRRLKTRLRLLPEGRDAGLSPGKRTYTRWNTQEQGRIPPVFEADRLPCRSLRALRAGRMPVGIPLCPESQLAVPATLPGPRSDIGARTTPGLDRRRVPG